MAREPREPKENGKEEKALPQVPQTINEAIRRMAALLIDPPEDRLPAFVPMQGYQVYDIELSLLRERAYDLKRDPSAEPLSKVARNATLYCLMGKGKYHMLLGNLAVGGLSNNSEGEDSLPKSIRNI